MDFIPQFGLVSLVLSNSSHEIKGKGKREKKRVLDRPDVTVQGYLEMSAKAILILSTADRKCEICSLIYKVQSPRAISVT